MPTRTIKELMIPIEEYATISQDLTLVEAMQALEESQKKARRDVQPYRAVLITDDEGRIVGKLGHRGFLQALEPRYELIDDMDAADKAHPDIGACLERAMSCCSQALYHLRLRRDEIDQDISMWEDKT